MIGFMIGIISGIIGSGVGLIHNRVSNQSSFLENDLAPVKDFGVDTFIPLSNTLKNKHVVKTCTSDIAVR